MTKKSDVSLMAFIAVILSALAWVLSNILAWLGVSTAICSILNLISTIILFSWALIAAYPFVKHKAVWVQVVYWVSVIIIVVGVIFNII